MKHAFLLLSITCLSFVSTSADYVICATSEQLGTCKKLGAAKKDLRCLEVTDSVECLRQIAKKKAHFGAFTPEEAILASLYTDVELSVVAEVRHPGRQEEDFAFETVVVVGKNFTGGFSALKNASYCHPGFDRGRYWSDRVLKYFESEALKHFEGSFRQDGRQMTADEEELYNLTNVFGKACRPGAWSVSDWWDKKLKKDYSSLCAACDFPSGCSYKSEDFNKHFSALNCLTGQEGAVAYTALGYVDEYFDLKSGGRNARGNPEDYQFLCEDGSKRALSTEDACTWIRQPWTAIISLSSRASQVSALLEEATEPDLEFSAWKSDLKKIITNGDGIIKFSPAGKKLSDYIEKGRAIPKRDEGGRSLNWCTISQKEKSKCELLAAASFTFGIPVNIKCNLATSKIECLKMIERSESDITFIDTQLGFAARKVYNLTTAAFVETERRGNYYGIVVTKGETIKRFREIKGKSACLPVYNGLGWLSHVQNVRRLNLVPSMLCSDSRGLWNFFSKACAPGAKTTELNKYSDITPNKMCQSCRTNGTVVCDPSPDNPYYSEIGALRCLNNGDGDVAFLDFNSVKKFFESGSKEIEKMELENFKILCQDETIKDFNLDDPEECSITQLNGGEIVMRENLAANKKRDIILTLMALDDLFGRGMKQYPMTFKMFEPFEGENGLLFKDSSVALISVFDNQNEYVNNYLKLQNEMSFCYRDNSGGRLYLSLLVTLSALIVIFIE